MDIYTNEFREEVREAVQGGRLPAGELAELLLDDASRESVIKDVVSSMPDLDTITGYGGGVGLAGAPRREKAAAKASTLDWTPERKAGFQAALQGADIPTKGYPLAAFVSQVDSNPAHHRDLCNLAKGALTREEFPGFKLDGANVRKVRQPKATPPAQS